MAEDEHAPHVVLVVDPECGIGPAAGPFPGLMAALAAAARIEDGLNADQSEPPVRVEVVRLFSAPRLGGRARALTAPEVAAATSASESPAQADRRTG